MNPRGPVDSSQESLRALLSSFPKKRIGVAGDVMLDIFSRGRSERLSPEAPVPVVISESEQYIPGGAANAACNVRALGGAVDVFGVVGDDERGRMLISMVQELGIDAHILIDAKRPTTTKQRIVAANRHLLRIDWESVEPISEDAARAEALRIVERMSQWDALIIADYAKGYLTEGMIRTVMDAARARSLPVIVDTKPSHVQFFGMAHLFTPNLKEACAMAGCEDVIEAGRSLAVRLQTPTLITRGPDGMTLFDAEGTHHLPTRATEVVDVSGAGDTVVAAAALAIASGATLVEAMELANIAAAIAIGKAGTSTVSVSDLQKLL
ncbi:bifunctional hydroxymethylpyrimidine kinase/phosphomethylpyrimidine kinase [Candidatus Kaiserbacteria bacterium]|nr:bifunctional hydroxymethylpyrimidine kinase/phosphomethylpyrimidine kinase [Candidatus Kaiserbacteria bacterium]